MLDFGFRQVMFNLADVAIEYCVEDANPPPQIRWHDGNGFSQLCFLDSGHFLLLRQLTTACIGQHKLPM